MANEFINLDAGQWANVAPTIPGNALYQVAIGGGAFEWRQPLRTLELGFNAVATEDGQVVIQSGTGGYVLIGHDGIDMGINRDEHRTPNKGPDKGHIIIDGKDMRNLFAEIDELREQMRALRPLVDYARNNAAQKIQRAWRRYMYAPGTGKWFRIAHDNYHALHNDYHEREKIRQ